VEDEGDKLLAHGLKSLRTGQRVNSFERSMWNGEQHLVADDYRSPYP